MNQLQTTTLKFCIVNISVVGSDSDASTEFLIPVYVYNRVPYRSGPLFSKDSNGSMPRDNLDIHVDSVRQFLYSSDASRDFDLADKLELSFKCVNCPSNRMPGWLKPISNLNIIQASPKMSDFLENCPLFMIDNCSELLANSEGEEICQIQ